MNSPIAHQDYREYLKQEWLSRHARNSHYSLRAFARDLSIGPGRLSNVLNGKKGLSTKGAEEVAAKLGLKDFEIEYFVCLVQKKHARAEKSRTEAEQQLTKLMLQNSKQKISVDHFKLISDWYHLAILQLMKLDHYQDEPEWIAKVFGIHLAEAKDALARLDRLGLTELKDGKRFAAHKDVVGPDGIVSDAVKNFHEQILKRASSAIYMQSPEDRDLNAIMFPCSKESIHEIRERIRQFASSIAQTFSTTEGNQVSTLSIQFFGLTKSFE